MVGSQFARIWDRHKSRKGVRNEGQKNILCTKNKKKTLVHMDSPSHMDYVAGILD